VLRGGIANLRPKALRPRRPDPGYRSNAWEAARGACTASRKCWQETAGGRRVEVTARVEAWLLGKLRRDGITVEIGSDPGGAQGTRGTIRLYVAAGLFYDVELAGVILAEGGG